MKGLIPSLASFIVLFCTFETGFGDTQVHGSVSGIWNAEDAPYIAVGNIYVNNRDTLIIEAGVEVRFDGEYSLIIYGLLQALGTEEDSVRFGPSARQEWRGLRFQNAESACRLEYCVITGGRATQGEGGLDELSCGGNIFINQSDITVAHSRISRGGSNGFGGGIHVRNSEITFESCLINDNSTSENAGGIGLFDGVTGIFRDCLITDNEASENGGGIYFHDECSPALERCRFHNNATSGSGGAVNINTGSDPHVSYCTFTQNSAGAGGAAYIRGEGTDPLVEWCEFNQNSARGQDRIGGAIYIRGNSTVELRYNRISQNNADYGGGLYAKEPPHSNIHHNLFLKNGATVGGGAFATSSDLGNDPLRLNNCTFVDNAEIGIEPEANAGYIRGGANVVISSSILWGERPHFSGEGGIEVIYSQVKNGLEGEGNAAENPDFFAGDSSWFILSAGSPCVDTGDPDLPDDPDATRNDRGWLHFPHNARNGILTDTLQTALWFGQNETLSLRYRNETGVPIYIGPMDQWRESEPSLIENIAEITGDSIVNGAAYTGGSFFLSGANNGQAPNMIYQLDRDLNRIDGFAQPGNPGGDGFFDLATDGGDILFGGYGNSVYEFTTSGEFGERYNGPNVVSDYRALGVDFNNPHNFLDFYIAGDEGIILRADSDLWARDTIEVGVEIISLAVKWNTRALYVMTHSDSGDFTLSLVFPDEDLVTPLYTLSPPDDDCSIGGIEITHDWETGRGSLVGIWRSDGSGDRLFVEDLYTAWLDIRPDRRLLMPGEETEWDVIFVGNMPEADEYESIFHLPVNGSGEGMEVYAGLESMNHAEGRNKPVPMKCQLGPVYPNPFNNQAGFTYTLTRSGAFQISIVDLTGRLIRHVSTGTGFAGRHRGCINADETATGIYFLKLTTPTGIDVKPLMIIK